MSAPGIQSYGAYVPPTRLALGAIGGRPAKDGGPERAVAWNDEDAVTMAATASVNCLRGLDRSAVDALFFASTTYPFREKQGAAFLDRQRRDGAAVQPEDVEDGGRRQAALLPVRDPQQVAPGTPFAGIARVRVRQHSHPRDDPHEPRLRR